MAKLQVSHYVQTLKQILRESQPAEIERNFDSFLRLLRTYKQSGLIDEIIVELEKQLYADEHIGVATVHHLPEQKPTASQLATLKKFLCQRFDFQDVEFRLIGDGTSAGLQTEINDCRFDWSLDYQLQRFKQAILTA